MATTFNRNQNDNRPVEVEIQGEEAVLNPGQGPETEGPEERMIKLPKTKWY